MISEDQYSPSSSSSSSSSASLSPSPSLRDRLFKSSMCLSGCFSSSTGSSTVHHEVLRGEYKNNSGSGSNVVRTPRSWLKSTAHELPEIRDRCRNLIHRIGRGGGRIRHHHNSGDFSYDPCSYALNFDDDSRDDEFPLRAFSSRLPPSPPECVAGPASVRREIVGFS